MFPLCPDSFKAGFDAFTKSPYNNTVTKLATQRKGRSKPLYRKQINAENMKEYWQEYKITKLIFWDSLLSAVITVRI